VTLCRKHGDKQDLKIFSLTKIANTKWRFL
jgi:hypothetical protein